ncbi:Protein phosphatase 2C 2 [Podila epigama]|nr:Protein phosphatase 2C 2 [Podila epigama]
MGQTLSAPIVEKHSSAGHDKRFAFGASAMQGWRITMEDAHTTLLEVEGAEGTAFFAVYDGHGGPNVAKYSGEGLHKKIIADSAFSRGEYTSAIKNGFLEMDRALRYDPEYGNDSSGCTAITATITDKNVLFVESRRIVAAGGFVEYGRVNGSLALSRALGDFEFKMNATLGPDDQIVTANPVIVEHKLTEEDEFLVLACDGIWDCMSSQEVVTFVRKALSERTPLDVICEQTMDHCLASDSGMGGGVGCDNMTMVIVAFLHGKTLDEWYDHIIERVAIRLGPADSSQPRLNGDEDLEVLPPSLTRKTVEVSKEAEDEKKNTKEIVESVNEEEETKAEETKEEETKEEETKAKETKTEEKDA